ncbi:MAG: hypothetical protein AAGE52_12835 [Myxococcota bacterium]
MRTSIAREQCRKTLPKWPACVFLWIISGCVAEATSSSPQEPGLEEPDVVEFFREPRLRSNVVQPEREHAELLDVEVFEDRLIFAYSSVPAALPAVGEVAVGVRKGGYGRHLVAMRDLGENRFEYDTEVAQLTDIWADLSFRMEFTPETEGAEVEVGARRDALGLGGGALGRGISCHTASGEARAVPVADFDYTITSEVDIVETAPDEGELQSAKFAISGTLTLGIDLEGSAATGILCSWKIEDSPLAGRLTRRWTTTVAAGPAPIILKHTIGPILELGASVARRIDGTAEARAVATVQLGFEKPSRDEDWRNISGGDIDGSFRLPTLDEVEASAEDWTASMSLTFGPKYGVRLYDAVGPDLGLPVELKATFSNEEPDCQEFKLTSTGKGQVSLELETRWLEITLLEGEVLLWGGEGEDEVVLYQEQTGSSCPDPCEEGGDGGSDEECHPCSAGSDSCIDCVRLGAGVGGTASECGWCNGRCVPAERAATCSTGLVTSPSACDPCDATECGTCAASGFCVWCPGVGCVNDSIREEFRMCTGEIHRNPGECAP